MTGMFTRGLMDVLANKVQPTAEQCDMFELMLAGKLAEKIGNSDGWHEAITKGTPEWGSFSRRVSCDYHPHPILAEAAKSAGITDDCPPFPIKTAMWINPGSVVVRYGYGAERKEIYSATTGRTQCGGCGCEIDPEMCWCGEGKHDAPGDGGHSFVPMGCDCHRQKKILTNSTDPS